MVQLPTVGNPGAVHAGAARVEVLDLLRMLAALAVVLFHYGFTGPAAHSISDLAPPAIVEIAKYGYLGVPLFFVISGFVIAYSAEGRTATDFAIARATRIYPGFLFCMTLTFLAMLAFGGPHLEPSMAQWVANIFIFAPALKQHYLDTVYWTIVSEITFYAWVWLMMLGWLFKRRIDLIVLAWLLLSLLNEIVVGSFAVHNILLTDQSGFFAAGLLLHEMFRGRKDASVQCLFGLATACAVLQALIDVREMRGRLMTDFNDWIVATTCLAAIIAVMLAVRVRRVPLPPGFIVAVGGLTYPLYLLHQNIGHLAFQQLEHLARPSVLVPMIVIGIIVASWAVWRYVERPGQRLMKIGLVQLARRFGLATAASRAAKPADLRSRTAMS